MGYGNTKIYLMTLFFCVIFFYAFIPSAYAQGSGIPVRLENYTLPQYTKNGEKLQVIIYGEKAYNIGAIVNLTIPILAIVKDGNYDINLFKPLNGVKIYPLKSSQAVIDDFWKDKTHFRAVITSSDAVYDKTTKILRGNEKAYFRSPEIDIDGVGFDAYQERKFIRVRSKVIVIIRPEVRRDVNLAPIRQNEKK